MKQEINDKNLKSLFDKVDTKPNSAWEQKVLQDLNSLTAGQVGGGLASSIINPWVIGGALIGFATLLLAFLFVSKTAFSDASEYLEDAKTSVLELTEQIESNPETEASEEILDEIFTLLDQAEQLLDDEEGELFVEISELREEVDILLVSVETETVEPETVEPNFVDILDEVEICTSEYEIVNAEMQRKYDTINLLVAECQIDAENCQTGKIEGLKTALCSQSVNRAKHLKAKNPKASPK